jgi:competence CoiA-like predicted nuclease
MSLITALDIEGNKVHIKDAKSGKRYKCDLDHFLIPKKGNIKIHHFAHLPDNEDCECLSWNYHTNKTEWHHLWQSRYPTSQLEIVLEYYVHNYEHKNHLSIDLQFVEHSRNHLQDQDL